MTPLDVRVIAFRFRETERIQRSPRSAIKAVETNNGLN